MARPDAFSEYVELRTEYITRLKRADLLDSRGYLRGEVVSGLVGYPIPGGRLAEYCEEHPEDPLCWVVDARSMADEFIDLRREFNESLKERDLLGVQRTITDVVAGGRSVGLLTPEQDPDDFGPLGPLVTPVELSSGDLPVQVGALY